MKLVLESDDGDRLRSASVTKDELVALHYVCRLYNAGWREQRDALPDVPRFIRDTDQVRGAHGTIKQLIDEDWSK